MQSKAKTVEQYLKSLPEDRRKAIQQVRQTILENLPEGIEEMMQYGMIGYAVPLSVYPPGYHCKKNEPLPYCSLASQKNFMAIYMFCTYMNKADQEWLKKEFKAQGKKLDMGKSCIRFKKIEDLPLDAIGKIIGKPTVKEFIATYEKAFRQR
jgi:uncharacterized protein YdhG (YjbR/CyaY superfamily)